MTSDLKKAIILYFAEFGEDFGDAMFTELSKPGGMGRLLRRFKLFDPGNTADQYATLLNHFRRVGPEKFLEMTGKKPLEFKLEIQPESKELRDFRTQIQIRAQARNLEDSTIYEKKRKPVSYSDEETKVVPKVPEEQYRAPVVPKAKAPAPPPAPKVGPQPTQGYSGDDILKKKWPTNEDGFPVGPLMPGQPPRPEDLKEGDLAWDPKKPYNPLGQWPEVERRSGKERRRKPDRRKNVDVVFKNQRFGKDRRVSGERRKNWPKDGFRK